jgi:hypothetical protein
VLQMRVNAPAHPHREHIRLKAHKSTDLPNNFFPPVETGEYRSSRR